MAHKTLQQRCKNHSGLFFFLSFFFLGEVGVGDRERTRKEIYEAFLIVMYSKRARNFEIKSHTFVIPEV